MYIRFAKLYMQIVCLMAISFISGEALAGWSDSGSHGVYKTRKYGDFPPVDIDDQLQDNMNRREDALKKEMMDKERTESTQIQDESEPPKSSFYQTNTPAQVTPGPGLPASPYQQPAANAVNNVPSTAPAAGNIQNKVPGEIKKKRKVNKKNSGFDMPWGNNNSNFSFPWNDNGSGFQAPWNNRRSSYNRPWDNERRSPWNNRRSGFGAPWDNNRSGFGAPWDNNRSGFSAPWDNDHSGFSFGPFGSNRHHR